MFSQSGLLAASRSCKHVIIANFFKFQLPRYCFIHHLRMNTQDTMYTQENSVSLNYSEQFELYLKSLVDQSLVQAFCKVLVNLEVFLKFRLVLNTLY